MTPEQLAEIRADVDQIQPLSMTQTQAMKLLLREVDRLTAGLAEAQTDAHDLSHAGGKLVAEKVAELVAMTDERDVWRKKSLKLHGDHRDITTYYTLESNAKRAAREAAKAETDGLRAQVAQLRADLASLLTAVRHWSGPAPRAVVVAGLNAERALAAFVTEVPLSPPPGFGGGSKP